MKSRLAFLGLVALATLGSCGKDGADVASVLLVSTVEVTPQSGDLVLGGTAQLTATPKTASGIIIPGRTVVWSSSNEAAVSVSPTGLITALALGGGPVTIKATVDGVAGESLIIVQPVPVNRVTVSPDQLGVMVAQSTQLTATAFDAGGDPLPGRVIAWQASNPAIAAVTTTGVVLGVSEGGPVTITATSEGKTGSSTVTVGPRPAMRLGLVQQPGSSSAGQPIIPAVRVAIQNDLGGTVTTASNQVTIALGSNPGGATLSGSTTVAAVSGIATFANLSLDRADAGYTLTVSSGSLMPATSSAFNIVAGSANQLAFTTAPPGTARSGVPLSPQPVLQLRDGSGNAAGQSGVVVTASMASGTATLSGGTSATTNAAGSATFSTLSLNGSSGTVTLAFSAPGLAPVISGPITLGAGNAVALAMVTQPSGSAQSGVTLAVQPWIELRDASGNDVNQGGVAITASIASGPAGATLGGGTLAITNGGGTAQFHDLAISGAAGSYTLSFSSGGLTPVISGTIALSAGAGSALAIVTQPSSSVPNGAVFPQQPAIQLRDPANNPVPQAGVLVTATLQSGGTLGGSTTVATNASGVATFTSLSITGGTGPKTLLFASTGYVSVASNTITVTASPTSQLSITTQPSSSATSGVAFSTQPAVQLRDAAHNPVSQSGVVVDAAIATGGGALGGTTTATTNSSGVATFTNLSIAGAPGSHSLGFGAPGFIGATSSAINITAAPATKLTITTQPSSAATSGAAFSTQPVIELRDVSDNPVSQSGVVVTATIASGGGTLGGTKTASTNASGVATFTNLSISGSAGGRTLSFSSGSLTPVGSATIDVTVGPASQLDFATAPPATAASGVTFSVAPVIQLENASGGAVSQSGVPVTVSVASGAATLGGTLTVSTAATGKATFAGLSLTGPTGSHTLRFTAPGLTEKISGTITLGAGPANKLGIVTQPSASAKSGRTFSQQPVVRILDSAGNPVFKSGVTITATINSGAGTLGGDRTKNTSSSGTSTFDDLRITGTGSFTLRFTATGFAQVISVTITVTP